MTDRLNLLEDRVGALEAQLARLSPELKPERPIAAIVADAAQAFGLTPTAIVAGRRDQAALRARYAITWVAREGLGLPLSVIGRGLGGMDHSSVRHQAARAAELRAADAVFSQITDRLRAAAEQRKWAA